MELVPATAEDIPFIAALERVTEAGRFTRAWPVDLHRAEMQRKDVRYYILNENRGARDGFAILRGIDSEERSIELKRIVAATPGAGVGRRALEAIMAKVFGEFGAHRLWLDTYADNMRAQHVYRQLGFRQEGTLRDAAKRGDGFVSLVLFAMLEEDWKARPPQQA